MIFQLQDFYVAYKWHMIMLFCVVLHLSSGLIFLFYGSAEVQEWGKPAQQQEKLEEKDIPNIGIYESALSLDA